MDFTSARLNMVESQVRTQDVTDLDLVDAMRAIKRERFCPADKAHLAYAEKSVEYAPGRFLLAPRDLAKLVFSARPRAGERALAIAAPYAAAVLTRMGLHVSALEPADGDTAVRMMLQDEGVEVVGGDLASPSGAHDVIVSEGAVARAPEAWMTALTPGGRLAVIERSAQLGKAQLYTKDADGRLARRNTFDAIAPYLAGFEPAPAFQF